jgi:hypothetical protein
MIRTARVVAMAAVMSLGACTAPTGPTEGRVEIGPWGGDRLRLEVTPAGATTEFDCAHGTIDEPLVADRNGRFSAAGTHTFEHGGPIRDDEMPNRHPARYEGRATGDTLQLTITVTDTSQVLGTYTLMRGSAPRLVRCL